MEEAVELGFKVPEPIPTHGRCDFCGAELGHLGLLRPLTPKQVLVWRDQPERCTCEKAKAYWADWDKKEAERQAEEERQKALDAEMERYEEMIRKSGMDARWQTRTFETFVTDTPGREKAYKQAKKYADSFDKMRPVKHGATTEAPEILRNGLYIAGGYGTGKTHLAAAIVNQLLGQKTACICMTMIGLLDRIKDSYRDAREEGTEAYVLSRYKNVPLLVIDDLGSEQQTEWAISKIFEIINSRYEAYMPTIITTNYSAKELVERMTPLGGDGKNAEKTVDRLMEMCAGISMNWESWRSK